MKFNIQTKERYRKIKSLIGDTGNKIVLDIGAGRMPISKGIKTKKTIRLDGVKDYDPDICCDINKGLPLKKGSIDIIIAGELIEHLYNPFKFIREAHRILKKGGFLVLSTPNVCSLTNRFKMLFGNLPSYCAAPQDDESFERHIIDFNLSILTRMLEMSGFKIVKKIGNGIIFHSRVIWPGGLTPPSFGETLIIKAIKK